MTTYLDELLVGQELRTGFLSDRGERLGSKEQVLDQNVLEVGALLSIETCSMGIGQGRVVDEE